MNDEEVLAQCRVETFTSGGKGGQHQNRRDTGVRLVHLPTGIVVTRRRERSQYLNRKAALAELKDRLEEMQRPQVERITTVVPKREKQRRLEDKRRRSEVKRRRREPETPTDQDT